jgi:hypothetical protein
MNEVTTDDVKPDDVLPYRQHPSWWGSPIVAIYALTVFLVSLLIAFWKGTDNLLTIMLGVAAANATTAVQYYLGSSASSQRKDQLLHDAFRR